MCVATWIAEQNAKQPAREFWFRAVQNRDDWKAPIEAFVPANADLDAIGDAIEHFTATKAEFVMTREGWIVKAIGYRAGPAGP